MRTELLGHPTKWYKGAYTKSDAMRLSNALTNLGQTSCESEVMEIGGLALGIQVLGTALLALQYI